ncbi:hypothetical protein BRARA_H03031 [Brassica rapa]|uniref:Uncharacterized protein n=1 Tax=Brassica campestris TaxID=3711 RepID=A0A397YNP4_BRACM|nr:hypothetical protein BRARA_H03031 [Brassica rapa]
MFNKLFPCCKFGEGRASHRGGDQKLLIRRNQRLRRYTETERSIKKLKIFSGRTRVGTRTKLGTETEE